MVWRSAAGEACRDAAGMPAVCVSRAPRSNPEPILHPDPPVGLAQLTRLSLVGICAPSGVCSSRVV